MRKMTMQSINQYLEVLRKDYLQSPKKRKSELLNEAEERTGLCRKHLIVKLKPGSNLKLKTSEERKKRKCYYDGYLRTALVKMWKIFDRPCGQRLKTLLETETDKLRILKELKCSDETAKKLKEINPKTIDDKLKHQKETEHLKRKYQKKNNSLLYQKIPTKLSDEWDRSELGNIQIDLVEHCGRSAIGEFINTLSITDIATSWWEGEAIMGKGQIRTCAGLKKARLRFPFDWKEIHPDNGKEFLNWHLYKYIQEEKLGFSRSRFFKKNDNCFVEQKNKTHVRDTVGHLRYDAREELKIINNLYRNELRLYKNFFQPVIKLIFKERIGGKVYRKYDQPKTPYQRIIESAEVSRKKKGELKKIYNSLNPAELKRTIDQKTKQLYQVYLKKNKSEKIKSEKKSNKSK